MRSMPVAGCDLQLLFFISKSGVQILSLHERHQIMPSMFKLQPEYFGPVATTKPVAGHADIGRLLAGYAQSGQLDTTG